MKKIAIVTDSNSGITQKEAKELDIYVLPMPFFVDGEMFLEGVTLTKEEFFKRLDEGADISTSMPSPGDVMDLWNRALEDSDQVLHIPMSSAFSGSCEAAAMLAKDFQGKVVVVDNKRITVTLEQAIHDAIALRKAGKTIEEMKETLEASGRNFSIFMTVADLKYLKKGGRISAAAATIGGMLNLKPVLSVQGDALNAIAKKRGMTAARRAMLNFVKEDIAQKFANSGDKLVLSIAHTVSGSELDGWLKEIKEHFPQFKDIVCRYVPLSIACHCGPGLLGIGLMQKVEV
ncbi:MAG: DegV family protein [Lachnospiraceae bacterium]|nr:DegV family protein [Lachnospiraceae bacterium]